MESKDAYDGKINASNSEKSVEPLPESERPRKDGPGGE
ncbi:AE-binding protein [Clostridium sp. AF15-17LB]|nr:AE-binding protein [Extibacter sp. GGCC_0201]RGU96213.1 AE-binding protein [Clostridium sp. AF15-17LB]